MNPDRLKHEQTISAFVGFICCGGCRSRILLIKNIGNIDAIINIDISVIRIFWIDMVLPPKIKFYIYYNIFECVV